MQQLPYLVIALGMCVGLYIASIVFWLIGIAGARDEDDEDDAL
jgi:hypothetical protein